MSKLIVCLLAVVPSIVHAETYVCVTDAAAAVGESEKKKITASVLDAREMFVYTNEGGNWIVKGAGGDYVLFDKCDSFFCERSDGYAGMFLLDKDKGTFSATWLGKDGDVEYLIVGKGRCTNL